MKAIVAVDENWAIGCRNQLLFRIPEDLRNFKQLTMGHPVILGRTTLETFPGKKPLPSRHNYVLSHRKDLELDKDKATLVDGIPSLLEMVPEDAFVIGGASVYEQLLPYCDTAYVTKIPRKADHADTFFPNLDEAEDWKVTDVEYIQSEYGPIPVETYVRVEPKPKDPIIRVFGKNSEAYGKLRAFADHLTERSPTGLRYTVEDKWYDFGQRWRWTTVVANNKSSSASGKAALASWQSLSPAGQNTVLFGTDEQRDELARKILSNEHNF